jgi:hypothetical protein
MGEGDDGMMGKYQRSKCAEKSLPSIHAAGGIRAARSGSRG